MTKKEKTPENYQKFITEGIIDDATMTASMGIGQLYHKSQFTDPSENEDEAYTITGLNDRTIIETIRKQEKLLKNGDVSSLEKMLLSQTHVLNAVLSNMVTSMSQADTLKKLETYGRLALKAQNQTRQTISTLAEIKGIKKTTFIHQTNNAHNQQVNNGVEENLDNSTNERVINDVDTRSEAGSKGENQPDEAMVISEDAGGASSVSPECTQARHEVTTNKRVREAVSHDRKTGARSKKPG